MKTEAVIQAIKETNGNLTAAARRLGCNRLTIYRHAEQYATVKQAIEESRESMLDMAESILYRKVLDGDNTALIFFLKTQGRRRGYIERQEVEHSGDPERPIAIIPVSVNYRAAIVDLTPGSMADSDASGEGEGA